MKKIFVLGASHHNTLSIVRSLGIEGYHVNLIIVGSSSSYVARSKYISNSLYFDNCEHLKQWLTNSEWEEHPILVSCSDAISQMLDMNYDLLKGRYIFFNAGKQGRITWIMDKQEQVSLAKSHGMIVPNSWHSKDYDPNIIKYPCIIKPLQSYQGGKHIWTCKDIEELTQSRNQIGEDIPFQIQELIAKKGEIVLPGLSLGGQVLIPGYILKHREFIGGTTYSSVKKHNTKTKQLAELAINMIREIGYEGLFGFEFMFDDNEKYYFLELNLRNDATCYSLTIAGCNLPAIYIKSICQNRSIETVPIKEIKSIVENKDFSNVLHHNIGLYQWIKQLRGAECKFLYTKEDPKPLLYCIAEQFTSKFHKR